MGPKENTYPCYIKTYKEGRLKEKINELYKILKNCCLCPRHCGVNRTEGEKGYCRSTDKLIVSSYGPHFGEEDPLVGSAGSGTIFFTNCNLLCVFCQNYEISHLGEGRKTTEEELSQIMIYLQNIGCHNINLVTPTHFVPQILSALEIAIEKGLNIPIVYNCGGYENVEIIKLLDGIIDIYMPDIKYLDSKVAKEFSNAEDYPTVIKEVIKEMHNQVGELQIVDGIAHRGLLVRHLVMPAYLASTKEVVKFIANEISKNTYLNIMDQYRPCYKARKYPIINRRITIDEFNDAIKCAEQEGLKRLDKRRAFRIIPL